MSPYCNHREGPMQEVKQLVKQSSFLLWAHKFCDLLRYAWWQCNSDALNVTDDIKDVFIPMITSWTWLTLYDLISKLVFESFYIVSTHDEQWQIKNPYEYQEQHSSLLTFFFVRTKHVLLKILSHFSVAPRPWI